MRVGDFNGLNLMVSLSNHGQQCFSAAFYACLAAAKGKASLARAVETLPSMRDGRGLSQLDLPQQERERHGCK